MTTNSSVRWPAGYFDVLDEAQIPKRQQGFYAHWVRQFFARPALTGSSVSKRSFATTVS